MTTATVEPTEATATPPANPQTRMRQLIDAAARGEPVDPVERRDLCFEIGWSRKVFDRHVRDQKARYDLPKEREQRQRQSARLDEIEAGRDAIRKECEAVLAEKRRRFEEEQRRAFAPINQYDQHNRDEAERLQSILRDDSQWNADYTKFMQRTADRRIGHRIAEENIKLLNLDTERRACVERLSEKKSFHEEIEQTGIGPRLVSRTPINRDWWKARFNEASDMLATLSDSNFRADDRSRWERQRAAAANRLGVIDAAKCRIAEIDNEVAKIQGYIAQLQEFFYRPECMHIDFNEMT